MFDASTAITTTSGTQSEQSQAKMQDDLNQFLNLLVTQLKNQDPLEPMDATEFTNQLVQFASIEQQITQNANLEKLLSAYHSTQVSNLTGYLGKTVESNGSLFQLEDGSAKISYTLYDKNEANTIIITDEEGEPVYSFEGERTKGRFEYTWDGKDKDGNQLPDGIYNFVVAPIDEEGLPLEYSQTVYNRVTSAGAHEGQITLFMGEIPVPLENIVTVTETPTEDPPADDPPAE